MANEQNLKPFKKGNDPRRNVEGRPRKFVTTLAQQGYSKSEVIETINAMMSMTMDELKSIWDDKDSTVLEKTIANAIKRSIEKGSLYTIESLLNRVHGLPKQETQTDIRIVDKFDFD